MAEAIELLRDALEGKEASIRRLLRYLFGAHTETQKNLLPKKDAEAEERSPEPRKPVKGDGRNGVDHFPGASRTVVFHETLKSGDRCPQCQRGNLSELALPVVTLQLEGRWQSRKIAVFMTGRRHAGENLPKSIGPGGMAFAAASPMGHGKPRAPSRGRRFRRPSPFAEHHPPSAGLRLRSRR